MSIINLNAAFRSSKTYECYIFVKDEFVVVNYNPGSSKDDLLSGPVLISEGFKTTLTTPFEHGIDCAFDTTGDQAIIFKGKHCAVIDYAPHTSKAKMLTPPMLIVEMFPCLQNSMGGFENGIDSGIRSIGNDVFLFKGDSYARINYETKTLVTNRKMRDGFLSLVGTVFENGIDAAFASHVRNEAYIFKGEYYARINFAPSTGSGDYIVGNRIKIILDDWSSLSAILSPDN